jgi:hypothetical protein
MIAVCDVGCTRGKHLSRASHLFDHPARAARKGRTLLERFTVALRTLDTSPKRKRVHAFREFTRLRFGLVGVCFVSSCAQTNREAL